MHVNGIVKKALAERSLMRGGCDLFLIEMDLRSGARALARPLLFECVTEDARAQIATPTLTIEDEEAEHLMQTLWDSGYRPKQYAESVGELRATTAHLKDLQAVLTDFRAIAANHLLNKQP